MNNATFWVIIFIIIGFIRIAIRSMKQDLDGLTIKKHRDLKKKYYYKYYEKD